MSKTIEDKAAKAYPCEEDFSQRRAWIKGYEQALADVLNHIDMAGARGIKFPVLDLYDWVNKIMK